MLILEERTINRVTASVLEELLSRGWRHFGTHFFRYNIALNNGELHEVIPLRIRLKDYQHSKSQRKTLRKAAHFTYRFEPISVDAEMEALFDAHSQKFNTDAPVTIHSIISHKPNSVPTKAQQLTVYDGDKLIGVSFIDLAEKSVSSIYGFYDLSYGQFRLGIYTMLLEIANAISLKKQYYYHGYCFNAPSFYDYKKRFKALEFYNWMGAWAEYPTLGN